MLIKKDVIGLIVMLHAAVFVSAQTVGTSYSEALRTKKAKLICSFSETPGYIASSKEGSVGVLPEIMSAFAAHMKKNNNVDITYDYQPFRKDAPITEIFENVNKAGEGVFGLVFVFITEERKKTLNLSVPVFESPSFLLTSNKAPDISTVAEAKEKWKGYTAFVNKGNYFEDRLKELRSKSIPDLKIEFFKGYTVDNISETVAKDKTLMYVDISGLLHAMEKKLPFKSHKLMQLSTPMGVILSKQNSWEGAFNKFLQSGFLKSNEFKKIIADNLGYRTFNLLKL